MREQTLPVQRVVGVDTGSRDRSGATLTELLGQDAVFGMDEDAGYGAAVARALQHPAARASGGAGGPAGGTANGTANGTEWIWLPVSTPTTRCTGWVCSRTAWMSPGTSRAPS